LPYAVARPSEMMEKSKIVARIKGKYRRAPDQVWLEWFDCMLWKVIEKVCGIFGECWVSLCGRSRSEGWK